LCRAYRISAVRDWSAGQSHVAEHAPVGHQV
jgi:hypothetical protein